MNSSVNLDYFYPNKMGRMLLLATEEILGSKNFRQLLDAAQLTHRIDCFPPNDLELQFSFKELARLQSGLEAVYGPRGGRGIALRSGQAWAKYSLREFGALLGLNELSFRLLPMDGKLRTGLQRFAETFNQYNDPSSVRVEEDDQCFYWETHRCPICWERQTMDPICSLTEGMLQEALFWVSGGKFFQVSEQLCIAKGDLYCTFVIDKRPLV